MSMNRAQFKKQLQQGLNAVAGQAYDYESKSDVWREYLDVETENEKGYVEEVMMAGFGAATVKAEGGGVGYQTTGETYTARYIFETIAIAFSITEEAEEDNLYGSIGKRLAKAAARSMVHTKAVKSANVLNNGFDATNYPIGDGAALLSSAHPVRVGGNQSNILTTAADLSETSLEDTLNNIEGALDDAGLPIGLTAMKLVVPYQLRFIAHRIMFANGRVDTNYNDPNAIKDMGMLAGGIVVDKRLTDTDAWFIKTDCPDGMKHIVRKSLSKKVEGDFDSGNMRFKLRERYVNGATDWRGVFGTAGG